jgi:hypothetical protein
LPKVAQPRKVGFITDEKWQNSLGVEFARSWKLERVKSMKLETQKPTNSAEPEKEQSTELRFPAWVLTVPFGLCLASMLIYSLRKLPEWLSLPVGLLLMFVGIGYGFWLGGELEWPSWLARKSPRWSGGDLFIEIKIPNWALTLLVGFMVSLFPIAFVKNLLPAQLFYPVVCLLLLAGNGFGIWLHSHLHNETKDKVEKDS